MTCQDSTVSDRGTAMRVAIIGAGPAGIAAAIRLRSRGYNDVKIYESAGRVGGKAMTVEIDGRHYDLGAALINSQRYPHTMALAHKYGVPMVPRDGRRAVIDLETGQWMDVIDALKLRHRPREYISAVVRTYRYVDRYRRYFDSPGFAFTHCPGLETLRREIALPLSEWARRRNVEPILARWEPAVADMGYGPYSSVAAQYALTYMLCQPRAPLRQGLGRIIRKSSNPRSPSNMATNRFSKQSRRTVTLSQTQRSSAL